MKILNLPLALTGRDNYFECLLDHESSHTTLAEVAKANAFLIHKLVSGKKNPDSNVGKKLEDFYFSKDSED